MLRVEALNILRDLFSPPGDYSWRTTVATRLITKFPSKDPTRLLIPIHDKFDPRLVLLLSLRMRIKIGAIVSEGCGIRISDSTVITPVVDER